MPAASESDRIRGCQIALGTSDARDVRKGSHPPAWQDPQGKPQKAGGENVSFCFGGVHLLPQLALGAAGLCPHCWAVQRGIRTDWAAARGCPQGWGALSQPSPIPGSQQGHEGRGMGWQLDQALPLHRQSNTMCSTLFPELNFASMLLFKALAFTYHLGCLSGLVLHPQKFRLVLPLHRLGSMSEGLGSIFCLLGLYLKSWKTVRSASVPTDEGQCHCLSFHRGLV